MREHVTAKPQQAPAPTFTPLRTGTLQRAAINYASVNEAPPIVHEVLRSPGQPLEAATRAFMGARFGQDFSRVRVHSGPEATASAQAISAQAYAFGSDIVLGDPSASKNSRLMAHELAHVAQAGQESPGTPEKLSDPHSAYERQADQAAQQVLLGVPMNLGMGQRGLIGRQFSPVPAPGVFLPAAAMPPDVKFKTLVGGMLTHALAREAMENYRKIAAVDRFKIFQAEHAKGNISKLLNSLSPADAANFTDELRELLRWVEEAETRAASGMTDVKIAETQAKFSQAEAEKQAKADLAAKGLPPTPSAADVESARKKKVEATSIPASAPTGWAAMTKAQKDSWTKRGAAAIKSVVAYATKNTPELKLVDADFLADFPGVEGRGLGVLAYGQPGGPKGTLAVFGYEFVKAVEADPGYVMEVVVHEVFGHPEYGKYGSEYHLSLYDLAMTKVPGYTKPAGSARTTEIDAYAYQETEIYSLLRGYQYHKPLDPKDKGKGLVTVDAPAWISGRVALIKKQWEPGLAKALARGLYKRYSLDPRITPAALDLYKNAVKANFGAADAADILK